MQVERLFEIMFILLHQERVTAKNLAERFHVSTRTIYRDIDILSVSGIPIYTNKGSGGGIGILPGFKLDKTLLSEKEQNEILLGLQCLVATGTQERGQALSKMQKLFHKENDNWLEIDFTPWGASHQMQSHFELVKEAIIYSRKISFDYYSAIGEKLTRVVEPYQLIFKGRAWYVKGFCRTRQAIRLFKLTRMRNMKILQESFVKDYTLLENNGINENSKVSRTSQVVSQNEQLITLRFTPRMAYRLYDDFALEQVKCLENGSFEVAFMANEDEWLYSYLLSFGKEVEVIHPAAIRKQLIKSIQEMSSLYTK